jgi:pimeloyl-ACP methyl ester carboxylesterase
LLSAWKHAVGVDGSVFLARVAAERPARFRTLTLVTPTGFRRGYDKMRAAEGTSREFPGVYSTLTFAAWRGVLFNGLVSRASIRYFPGRTFGSKDVDESLVDYSWRTTHQPGADRAPFAFLSGRLFSADIRTVYEKLALPVWLAHGTQGDFADFSETDWLRKKKTGRSRRSTPARSSISSKQSCSASGGTRSCYSDEQWRNEQCCSH